MKGMFKHPYAALLIFVFCSYAAPIFGQGFNFKMREESVKHSASQIKAHGLNDTITVYQSKWDEMANAGASWGNNLKFKSVHAFVRFYVDHSYGIKVSDPYIFRLAYKLYGYSNINGTSPTIINDTLTIAYKPDSLASYQDVQMKQYNGFHKIMIVTTGLYEISNASAPPVPVDISPTGNFSRLNFGLEGSIMVQPFHKRVNVGTLAVPNYKVVYGIGAPALVPSFTLTATNTARVTWNLSGAAANSSLELLPVNYELEWTYVDNYKVTLNDSGLATYATNTAPIYDFRHNATRVVLDTNGYDIPLTYQKGFLVYRVRMVRPDSVQYRYPVYGQWSLTADSGLVSGTGNHKITLANPHLDDKLNWQYTVSFAEQGKYKHVMSYYDGMLKNRQSITRFNSMPNKLIATMQVYDYEGRPAISVLPTPISSADFKYQPNLAINAVTTKPYKAADFDYLQLSLCPNDNLPPKLANNALANIYYSPLNPDKAGVQKFVPDAGGYPFVQTVYSPGYDERVEKQGGAGDSLQIGLGHTVKNDFVSSNQMDLNRLFGADIGWTGFYRKTISKDPNGQLSLNVTDYRGKTVTSSLIGIPDLGKLAMVANTNVPDTSSYKEDFIAGTTQQVMGNKIVLDKSFFNDAGGNDTAQYVFSFSPYQTFCPGKYLSVKAGVSYQVFDECGNIRLDTTAVFGTSGVLTSGTAIAGNFAPNHFYMQQGKHSLHKELTIKTSDVEYVVDSFISMKPAQNCLKTEQQFIKESVLSKQFPCPEDYLNLNCHTCAGKEFQMMQELWPNKDSVFVVRKYGVYDKTAGFVIGNNNSIFTLYNAVTNAPLSSSLIEYIKNGGGTGGGPEGGGGTGGGGWGTGLNGTFVINQTGDTIYTKYRYQDPCLVQLPNTVNWMGQVFTNIQSLPVDTFIMIFNDTIAKALLPLHPEYCNLLKCVDDAFLNKLYDIQDYHTAEIMNLFRLDQIIAADPLYAKMLTLPAQYPHPMDTLVNFGPLDIESHALLLAYCNCSDSILLNECKNGMFAQQIANGTLINDFVKEKYYTLMKSLYIGNRSKYAFNLNPLSTPSGCAVCAPKRMTLVPEPVFTQVFNPDGTPATGPGSFMGQVQSANPAGGAALNNFLNILQQTDTTGFGSLIDSTENLYNSQMTQLCSGAINNIIEQLVNCADSAALAGVKASLTNLCTTHQVEAGNYTSEQIRAALVANGIALGDLCNPYLVNYDNFNAGTGNTFPFGCNSVAFYDHASTFFNQQLMTALQAPGTEVAVNLDAGNLFALQVRNVLGQPNVKAKVVYTATQHLVTLYLYKTLMTEANAVKVYFKTASSGTCANPFAPATGATLSIQLDCVKNMPIGDFSSLASGYVAKYIFAATVKRTVSGQSSYCLLPGWNNKVEMNYDGANPLSEAMAPTKMRALYKEFWDTLGVYQVKGADHPYYTTMLRNFMNQRVGRAFTAGQYERFIESCALADSMEIPKYGAYAQLTFSTTALAQSFVTALQTFDTGFSLHPFYYCVTDKVVALDFNQVPVGKLRKYRDFVNGYAAASANKPFLAYAGSLMGALYIRTDTSFVPTPALVFGTAPYPFTFTLSGTTKSIQLGDGTTATYRMYQVKAPTGATLASKSANIHVLSSFLYGSGIPGFYIPLRESTVDGQYAMAEKKAFLKYAYKYQSLPESKVLDTLQVPFIANASPLFLNKQLSYGHPADPGRIRDFYFADPASATVGTNYAKLTYILETVRAYVQQTTGVSSIIFGGPNTLQVNANLTAFRNSDGSFLYRYFGAGDTLYNAYLRMPDYMDTALLPFYAMQSYRFNMGEGESRSFHVKLVNTQNANLVLELEGFTDFVVARNGKLEDVLLTHPTTNGGPMPDTVGNCERQLMETAIYQGRVNYRNYIDSVRAALLDGFWAQLMNGAVTEKLFINYRNQRFNYTLYYYDRAGNLMTTVPPAGMNPLANNMLAPVDANRGTTAAPAANLFPAHKKRSYYKYNSLNQVVNQTTPDGGNTDFFYDAAGRAIFSQNAKQKPDGMMTYTLYDKQGRVMETGEAKLACSDFVPYLPGPGDSIPACSYYDAALNLYVPFSSVVTNLKAISHEAVVAYVRSKTRSEVVVTQYDTESMNLGGVPGMSAQENLRKRVSDIKYFDYLQPANTQFNNYTYAMHFSYDIPGNVKTLTRDYPGWGYGGQRYKRVDYDYDAISGKVNMLGYNRGFADQYYQRYGYDADTRIVGVESSSDGYLWDADASYNYYQHGPLARMTLGTQRVQGVDYAYTIQGWLKAVNGDLLDSLKDMGNDGMGNLATAPDAAAFTLDYFKGDYRPIGTTAVAHIAAPTKSMYNGNIPRATMAVTPFRNLSTQYTYDQLNRIMRADYAAIAANGTLANTADYYSSYGYDPDGNLQKLVRNGDKPATQRMDSLVYRYAAGGNDNKLLNVNDYAADNYTNDLRYNVNAALSRYLYDATGNLVKDLVGGQDSITWSHYNKVSSTRQGVAGNSLAFDYDGAGQRYQKMDTRTVGDTTTEKGEYYVRDAQGNILAVYKAERVYQQRRAEWVATALDGIKAQVGQAALLHDFLVPAFGQEGHFKAAVLAGSSANASWTTAQLALHPVSWYVGRSVSVKSNLLSRAGTTSGFFVSLSGFSDQPGNPLFGGALNKYLSRNGQASFLNAVFGVGQSGFDASKRTLALGKLCSPGAGALAEAVFKSLDIAYSPSNCGASVTAVNASVAAGRLKWEDVSAAVNTAADRNGEGWQQFLYGFTSDASLMGYAGYVDASSGSSLLGWFVPALDQYAEVGRLGSFLDGFGGARAMLEAGNGKPALLSVSYDGGTAAYLDSWVGASGMGDLVTGLAAIPNLQVPSFLGLAASMVNYDMTALTATLVKYQRTDLSAHVLYGSSRLGTRDYLPGQHYLLRDNTGPQPIVDTMTLSGRAAWYSSEVNDAVSASATEPWGASFTGNYGLAHTVGQKQYEVSNHLGNVQATISDLKYAVGKPYGSVTARLAALRAAYDYYPFGMLMPGRFVTDTSTQCVTVMQQKWLWRWVIVKCWDVVNWVWPGYAPIGHGSATLSGGNVSVVASTVGDGVSFTLPVAVGVKQSFSIEFGALSSAGAGTAVRVQELRAGKWVALASVEPRRGLVEVEFTPTASSVQLVFAGPMTAVVSKACIAKWDLVQDQVLVDICDWDKDRYRFGYNGQEKLNEWAGVGNFNEFKARGEDTRIGRFLSIDPLSYHYPWYSPYQYAGNDPIRNIDLEGLEPTGYDIRSRQNDQAYLQGKKSESEWEGFYKDNAVAGAVGGAVVVDAILLKGKASQFLYSTIMAGSFYDNKSKNSEVNRQRTQEFKENLVWGGMIWGFGKVLGSIVRSAGVGENELRIRVGLKSSDEVNALFSERGWHAPYKSGVSIAEFQTPKKWEGLVRLSGPDNIKGSWFTTSDQVKGLTPAQLRGKFSLKYEPTNITPISLDAGSNVRVGEAAGVKDFGTKGGGYQVEVVNGGVNYGQTQPIKK